MITYLIANGKGFLVGRRVAFRDGLGLSQGWNTFSLSVSG